jgi:hypothetical protein
MARVQVLNETEIAPYGEDNWVLCFQWCRYQYNDGTYQHGYRFIWRRPKEDGAALQAARGQARIPSISFLQRLVKQAKTAGWGDYDGDKRTSELDAAANRLRSAGMVVDIEGRFVGWPSKEAIRPLTAEQIEDAKLITGKVPELSAITRL